MVLVAEWLMRLVVVQVFAGSIPVKHPKGFKKLFNVGIAQLVRVLL